MAAVCTERSGAGERRHLFSDAAAQPPQAGGASSSQLLRVHTPEPAADIAGSRRRRLWELDAYAPCPVIGLCLPVTTIRRLATKVLGTLPFDDDYRIHCEVVAHSKKRTRLAEALQRELEQRAQLALRRVAKLRSEGALLAYWQQASSSREQLPGALWATLTHTHCSPALEQRVLGDVHMLQHQVGIENREERTRLAQLIEDHARLQGALAVCEQAAAQRAREHAAALESAQVELMRMRAALMGRETLIDVQRAKLQELEEHQRTAPGRLEIAREHRALVEEVAALRKNLRDARSDADRHRLRAAAAARETAELRAAVEASKNGAGPSLPTLSDCSVLCVGGRPSIVPIYRSVVERTGGRFLHHDGGEEHSAAALEATLAAADLVICQTGCVSHAAYWRVKDHCKRTGKRCVFVESPSRRALERALVSL